MRSLARIAGAAHRAEGPFVRRTLTRDDLRAIVARVRPLDEAARSLLPGVSEGRARQLYAGALVAEAALDLLQVEQLDNCPWALREGLILRRLDHLAS
jgi:exopolyphosphatase/guanosine-5'-triphosphate,3'-diphosphate pyrophosphatase